MSDALFFNLLFFVSAFSLDAVEVSQELLALARKTNENSALNAYIQKFPLGDYEITNVPNLGVFCIDNISDGIKEHLRKGIYWESTIGILIRLFTRPDTIAVDLGAHIGIHTLVMSRKVGPEGLVIAFEPQFKIFRELHYNLNLNDCSHNVIALRNAVGDTQGVCELGERNPSNEGGTSIGHGGDTAYMVSLDSLNLNNISLIKMDVESYEINVLRGAKQTLMRNKPVVILEILGNHDLDRCNSIIKAKYNDVLRFFDSISYDVQRIWGNDFIAFPQDYFEK